MTKDKKLCISIVRVFATTVLFLLVAPYANSQALPAQSVPAAVEAIHLAKGTVTTVATANGVAANAAASVPVNTPSGHVNVPVNIGAQVSRAAIAKAVAKGVARSLPAVALAETIAEIADALSDKGYRQNPNGDIEYPERPGYPSDSPGTGYRTLAQYPVQKTPFSAVEYYILNAQQTMVQHNNYEIAIVAVGAALEGRITWIAKVDGFRQYLTVTVGRVPNHYVPDYILATEVQTEADVLQRMAQQAHYQKSLYDALKRDQRNYPGVWPDILNPTSPSTPATVDAPPVSSPSRVASTENVTNPDGSTRTRTTTEQSTVSPVVKGGTLGDIGVTFPNSTTTTVTDVDNATGAVTTGTTVVNNPIPEAQPSTPTAPTEIEIDTCGLPGKPKCLIDEADTPDGKDAFDEQKTAVNTAFDDVTENLTTITSADDKDTSWGWTPASWFGAGQCEPFNFGEMPTLGIDLAFDVCPHLESAAPLISFMWVLTTIGMILTMVFQTMNGSGA